jgi:outer membrane protein assembly factor BamA
VPFLPSFAAIVALTVADTLPVVPDSVGRRVAADSARPWRLLAVPAITSQPETGFAGAFIAYAVHTPRAPDTRPAQYELGVQVTQKQQARVFVEWDRWALANAWRVQGTLEYRVYPLPYYGVGPTAALAAEEIYTPRGVILNAVVQRRIGPGWYAQGGVRGSWLTISERAPTGVLVADTVPGASGASLVQWRGALLYDTRDDVLTPRRGAFVSLGMGAAVSGLLSDGWSYGRAVLDARHYRTRGRLTVASQVVAEGLHGRAPFDDLPMLGTKAWMRGYALGRYRDRALAAAQVEGRLQLTRRIAGALWAGGGTVGSTFQSLAARTLLPTVGVGGRWGLFSNSRAQLRADLAYGRDGSALYLNLNEAF